MTRYLILAFCALLAPVIPASAFLLATQGPQIISSSSITCGTGCVFAPNTASTVGQLNAVMSPTTPLFNGSWSIQMTGTVNGQTCDASGFFSISGNNLNVSSAAVAGIYQVCYVATQLGAAAPLANVVSVSNTPPLTFVQGCYAAAGVPSCTFPNPTSSGNTVVGMFSYQGTGPSSITVGGTTALLSAAGGPDANSESSVMFCAANVASGAGTTITAVGVSGGGYSMVAGEYFNSNGCPGSITAPNVQNSLADGTNVILSAQITPALSGSLLFGTVNQSSGGGTYTAGSSPNAFTLRAGFVTDSQSEDFQPAPAAPVRATFSVSGSTGGVGTYRAGVIALGSGAQTVQPSFVTFNTASPYSVVDTVSPPRSFSTLAIQMADGSAFSGTVAANLVSKPASGGTNICSTSGSAPTYSFALARTLTSNDDGAWACTVTATQAGHSVTSAQVTINVSAAGAQTIVSVSSSGNSFAGGAASGTVVGAMSVTMNPTTPAFTGTLSLANGVATDPGCSSATLTASSFQLSSTTLPSNLQTNGTLAAGTYCVKFVATQAGISNSPFSTSSQVITGTGALTGFVMSPCTASLAACSGQTTLSSDSNAGTLAAPVATLQGCQTKVRAATGANKVCNIRAGTYTGGGSGYTAQTVTGNFTLKTMLHLTSADSGASGNPTTYQIYPPDFPSNGISTADFDGGAGAFSPTAASPNCTPNANPTVGIGTGIYIDGASFVTINGLNIHNTCYAAIAANNGQQALSGLCFPNVAGGSSTNIVISNNVLHDIGGMFAQCGDIQGQVAAVMIGGRLLNVTVSHNYLSNDSGMGIYAGSDYCCNFATEYFTNLTIDHNFLNNFSTYKCDTGAIYAQDPAQLSSGLVVSYNYVMNAGGPSDQIDAVGCDTNIPGNNISVGGSSQAYYIDEGMSNVHFDHNIAMGLMFRCFFAVHASNGTNVYQYNICDEYNPGLSNPSGFENQWGYVWQTTSSCWPNGVTTSPCPIGTVQHLQNIQIAGIGPDCSGDTNCVAQNSNWTGSGGVLTFGNNAYYNYGSAGPGALSTLASSLGDHPTTVDAFSKCPGGTQNSWGYVIPAGNAVLSPPVSYPPQPAGYASPGFWGPQPAGWNPSAPQGFVIPHTLVSTWNGITASYSPTYGPTC